MRCIAVLILTCVALLLCCVCVWLQVWATGHVSQRVLGDTPTLTTPVQLSSPTNVVQVVASMYHTMFVDASGAVRPSLEMLALICECLAMSSGCFLFWVFVL